MPTTGPSSSRSRSSLSDILGKDEAEDKSKKTTDDKSTDDSSKEDSKSVKENDKSVKDAPKDTDTDNDDRSDEDLIKPASEKVEEGKPVDNQVSKKSDNDKDPFGNPDGVTNSGGMNAANKTPADMSAESAEETMARYGYTDEIPQDVLDNPNVELTGDVKNFQMPGGTHVHPDIARDNYNRRVGGRTEHGNVSRVVNEQVYATEAPVDDKGIKNRVPEDLA